MIGKLSQEQVVVMADKLLARSLLGFTNKMTANLDWHLLIFIFLNLHDDLRGEEYILSYYSLESFI